MTSLLGPVRETDHLGDYADLDPALLASLRTDADEDALAAALNTQLTTRVTAASVSLFAAQRRRVRTRTELRAA